MNKRSMAGLTSVPTRSEILSASNALDDDDDSDFAADSDQTLHSLKVSKLNKMKTFLRKIIDESDDIFSEVSRPDGIQVVDLDPEEV